MRFLLIVLHVLLVTCHLYCAVLQVLGRSEFKQLLRWRLTLRRDLKQLLGGSTGDAEKSGTHKKVWVFLTL
jgi:aromatic ring-cleaving dioxygenase